MSNACAGNTTSDKSKCRSMLRVGQHCARLGLTPSRAGCKTTDCGKGMYIAGCNGSSTADTGVCMGVRAVCSGPWWLQAIEY